MVRFKALEISRDAKYRIPPGQFKASYHWCQRFPERNDMSLQQKTMLVQCLPLTVNKKSCSFIGSLSNNEVHVRNG